MVHGVGGGRGTYIYRQSPEKLLKLEVDLVGFDWRITIKAGDYD